MANTGVHATHELWYSRTIKHQSATLTQRVTYPPGRELCPATAGMSRCNTLGSFSSFWCSTLTGLYSSPLRALRPGLVSLCWRCASLTCLLARLNLCAFRSLGPIYQTCQNVGRPGLLVPTRHSSASLSCVSFPSLFSRLDTRFKIQRFYLSHTQ